MRERSGARREREKLSFDSMGMAGDFQMSFICGRVRDFISKRSRIWADRGRSFWKRVKNNGPIVRESESSMRLFIYINNRARKFAPVVNSTYHENRTLAIIIQTPAILAQQSQPVHFSHYTPQQYIPFHIALNPPKKESLPLSFHKTPDVIPAPTPAPLKISPQPAAEYRYSCNTQEGLRGSRAQISASSARFSHTYSCRARTQPLLCVPVSGR